MKTEELKELGLAQDVIDKIFAMNGKDINAEKAKTKQAESERDNYKTQLDTAKESLGKFDGINVDELKAQITSLQNDLTAKDEEYAAKEAARDFVDTLNAAITAAGGKNAKAIRAILDIDELKESKDRTADINAAVEAVKETDNYLFNSEEPHKNPVGATGGGTPSEGEFAAMRALMGLPKDKK